MFCKNCGNQMPDGAKFCNKCGYVMNGQPGQAVPPIGNQGGGAPTPQFQYNGTPQTPQSSGGGNRNKIIILIVLIIAALAGGIVAMKIVGVGPFEKTQVTETEDQKDDDKDKDDDDDDKDKDDDDDEKKDDEKVEEDEGETLEEDEKAKEEEVYEEEESLEDSDAAVRKKIGKDKKDKKKKGEASESDELSEIEEMIFLAQSRQLTESDLRGFSSFELSAIRNGIYAYRGYVFQTDQWNEYFSDFDWYDPDPDFEQGDLNTLENKNATLIKEYEEDNYGGIYTF